MHPHEEHGERFWEEVRLLERVLEDVTDKAEIEQVQTVNLFLNEHCDVLSVGHEKCSDLLEGDPSLPAYDSVTDYEDGDPHVVGCYGCSEMYQNESDGMPEPFEDLRELGVIKVRGYEYSRIVS